MLLEKELRVLRLDPQEAEDLKAHPHSDTFSSTTPPNSAVFYGDYFLSNHHTMGDNVKNLIQELGVWFRVKVLAWHA